MIAYFDTSALLPLLVEEPGSVRAGEVWDGAERMVTARVAYPEGRAALARARRLGRLGARTYGRPGKGSRTSGARWTGSS